MMLITFNLDHASREPCTSSYAIVFYFLVWTTVVKRGQMQRERWKIIAPTHVLPNGHGVFKPFTISDPVSRNHFNVNMYVFPAYPTPLAAQARITHRCLSLLHQQISSFSFWVTQQSHFRFGHFSRRGGLWTPRLHKDWGQFKEFD